MNLVITKDRFLQIRINPKAWEEQFMIKGINQERSRKGSGGTEEKMGTKEPYILKANTIWACSKMANVVDIG